MPMTNVSFAERNARIDKGDNSNMSIRNSMVGALYVRQTKSLYKKGWGNRDILS